MEKCEESLQTYGTSSSEPTHITEISEAEKDKRAERLFKETITENSSNLEREMNI